MGDVEVLRRDTPMCLHYSKTRNSRGSRHPSNIHRSLRVGLAPDVTSSTPRPRCVVDPLSWIVDGFGPPREIAVLQVVRTLVNSALLHSSSVADS